MTTRCTRCATPASALMRFEYATAHIWLDDLDALDDTSAYPFCDRHATAMTPPVGWSLDDRRSPMRALFSVDVA